tara:strand:- start:1937 stop:2812 length:876 start_codon:yes stop_codon:yes gene_type:complete
MNNYKKFYDGLLLWYQQNKIPFPWQNQNDPFYAFVAGYCAQQTQIHRVIEIWTKLIKDFPTIAKVANASNAELLKTWDNAGYPRRIINMKKAAQIIMNEHDGIIPNKFEQLKQLPGIGDYTAAVILSFGHKQDIAAIDINFMRILSRYFFGKEEIKKDDMHNILKKLNKKDSFHFWNPAIMDFGSLICNAKPKCEKCIFNKKCTSYTKNLLTKKIQKRKQYIGSNRFFRGKILFLLRKTKNNKIKETKLKQKIKNYKLNKIKYKKIILELEKDELISIKSNYIYLGNYKER